jgi:cell division protein FtsB
LRRLEEKQKSLFRKKLLAVALGLLFLILLIASFFGKNGLIEMYRAKKKHQALILEIERLEKIKQKLERDITELENNPKAVEQKAREKLWLMKPDEIVIIKKEK